MEAAFYFSFLDVQPCPPQIFVRVFRWFAVEKIRSGGLVGRDIERVAGSAIGAAYL
jgi:hypothetical protein